MAKKAPTFVKENNMKFKEILTNYINNYEDNEPILIEEIKEHFKNMVPLNEYKSTLTKIYVYINRIINKGKLKVYIKGVYYKGTITEYQIIKKKYIKDDEGIKGFLTGNSLLYTLKLKDNKPKYTELISNSCYKGSRYKNETLNVIVHKPRIKVTTDNYLYLQLFELIKLNCKKEIIYKFISDNNLELSKIHEYARICRYKRVLERLY